MSSEFEIIASKLTIQVGENLDETLRVLTFEPEGEKKATMVLIPGFISLPLAWDELLMKMKDDYHIIYIETREKHTSKINKSSSFTAERLGDDMAQVLDYLMIEEYFLVTSSMLAAVVLRALSRKVLNPKFTFLIGPVVALTESNFYWFILKVNVPIVYFLIVKPLAKLLMGIVHTQKDQRGQTNKYKQYLDNVEIRRARKCSLQLKALKITEAELKTIRSKCILVAAEKDKAHRSKVTHWMHKNIKDSEYEDLETNIAAHGLKLFELIEEKLNK